MSRDYKTALEKRWEVDAESRWVAQSEFERPVLLEAGAGTGKTAALTARVVAWCLDKGWKKNQARLSKKPGVSPDETRIARETVDRVLAVTFTDAAAAEMTARICKAFREISMGEKPVGVFGDFLESDGEVKRRRAGMLLSVQDRLKISTLHGFCRRILAEYPMETGLHPMADVDADETATAEIVRELLEDRLPPAYESEDPDMLVLADMEFGPQAVSEAITEIANKAVAPSVFEKSPFNNLSLKNMLDSLRDAIAMFKKSGGEILESCKRGNSKLVVDMVRDIDAVVQDFDAFQNGAEPVEVFDRFCNELQARVSGTIFNHLSRWGEGNFNATETKAIKDISADEVAAASSELHLLLNSILKSNPKGLEAARKTMWKLYRETVSILRRRGVLSFDALIRHTVELLENNPVLCRRLAARFDQLLVDEFQDTDDQQCRMLELLALNPSVQQKPGLFLVGDPKQSIYGWRKADLEAYDRFKEKVSDAGGKIHALSKNFRSVPAILAEVDRVLEPVMKHEPGLQPVFQILDPCPEKQDAPGFEDEFRGPVEYWVSWMSDSKNKISKETKKANATEMEAEAVARDISELRKKGVSPSDIGILFRSTGDLEVYVAALRKHSIPYSVSKDRNYYKRREIIDAAALVRCIVDPNDQLALLTLLRSPMVGVPDAALIPLWAEGFPEAAVGAYGVDPEFSSWVRDVVSRAKNSVPEDVPGIHRVHGWHHNLCVAMDNLGLLREMFHAQPVDVFTETLRRLFLLEPMESCRYLGRYRVANLERFFDELTGVLGRKHSNVQVLLRYLRTSVAEEQEAPEAGVPEATRDAVRLMTIHGAKGLDFPHVYLVQTHKGSRPEIAPKNDVQEIDGDPAYILFGFPTWNYERIMEKRKKIRSRELMRTLYVALTRAAERLVILGKWPLKKAGDPLFAKTYVNLLTHRTSAPIPLVREFEELPQEILFDEERVIWRFLKPEDSSPRIRKTRKKTKKLEYDSQKLIELMKESTSRMRRPMSMKVTRASGIHVSGDETRVNRYVENDDIASPESHVRAAAVHVGSAVHKALESWDFKAPVSEELSRQSSFARRVVQMNTTDPDVRAVAIEKTVSLLEEFAKGRLFEKMTDISQHILARELQVLAPPRILEQYFERRERDRGASELFPLGYVIGTVDLVYEDPANGETVVADYKTDNVYDPDEIESKAALHASQMHLYGMILKEAMKLTGMPRLELWFVRPQMIVNVPYERDLEKT